MNSFKIKYSALIIALFIFPFSLSLSAQNKIDPTLEVKRDFDGKILDIAKSKLNTQLADSIKSFNLNIEYSIFNKPYKDLYEFSPLPSAQIQKPVKNIAPFIYADFGLNYPTNPHLDLYIQPRLKSNTSLLFYANHSSFLGNLRLLEPNNNTLTRSNIKANAQSMKNNVGAKFGLFWKKGEFNFDFNYKKDSYTFYGLNAKALPYGITPENLQDSKFMRDSLSHQYDVLSTRFGIKSTNTNPNSFYYNFSTELSLLHDVPSLMKTKIDPFNENYIKLSATVGPNFAYHHKFYITSNFQASNALNSDKMDRALFDLYPHYKIEYKRVKLEAGLKFSSYFTPALKGAPTGMELSGEKDKTQTNIHLKALASVEILKNKLWVYAKIDGGNYFQTYHNLISINPWLSPKADMFSTNLKYLVQVGVNGQMDDRFSYHLYVGSKSITRSPFYYQPGLYLLTNNENGINATYNSEMKTGQMLIGNYDMKKLSVGAEVSWKSDDFQTGISLQYNNLTVSNTPSMLIDGLVRSDEAEIAYGQSPFDLKGYARYNWRERIVVSSDIQYRAKTPDYGGNIPAFTKIDLTGTYVYDKNLSLYFKANNILNAKEQYFLYYRQIGINFGIGVNLKF